MGWRMAAEGSASWVLDVYKRQAVGRVFSVFLYIPEGKKFSSCMVKHTVHNDLNLPFMSFFYEFFKILVVAQTSVY